MDKKKLIQEGYAERELRRDGGLPGGFNRYGADAMHRVADRWGLAFYEGLGWPKVLREVGPSRVMEIGRRYRAAVGKEPWAEEEQRALSFVLDAMVVEPPDESLILSPHWRLSSAPGDVEPVVVVGLRAWPVVELLYAMLAPLMVSDEHLEWEMEFRRANGCRVPGCCAPAHFVRSWRYEERVEQRRQMEGLERTGVRAPKIIEDGEVVVRRVWRRAKRPLLAHPPGDPRAPMVVEGGAEWDGYYMGKNAKGYVPPSEADQGDDDGSK